MPSYAMPCLTTPPSPPSTQVPSSTASLSVAQGAAVKLAGLVVEDADVSNDSDGALYIKLSAGHGMLKLSDETMSSAMALFETGEPSTYAPELAFTAPLPQAQALLASLQYRAPVSWDGDDSVSIVADDQGYTGLGGSQVANAAFTVAITASPILPNVLVADGAVAVSEDTPVPLGGTSGVAVRIEAVQTSDLASSMEWKLTVVPKIGTISTGSADEQR